MSDLDELIRRRETATALAEQVRRLVDAQVTTRVADADLVEVTRRVAEAAALLEASTLGLAEPFALDDAATGVRMYCPVVGVANGAAPPVATWDDAASGGVSGECVLTRRWEGPPGYVHGGASALVLDQMVGLAAARARRPALTRSLTLDYRGPVPLDAPLGVHAIVEDDDGRRTVARARLWSAADPERVLVSAEAVLVTLTDERAAALFAGRAGEQTGYGSRLPDSLPESLSESLPESTVERS